jgi:hypothetical protein
MLANIKGVFGMAPLKGLLQISQSHFGGATPPKRLRLRFLCFLLKNSSSRKAFGKAPSQEPEPVRSPAKHAQNLSIKKLVARHGFNFVSKPMRTQITRTQLVVHARKSRHTMSLLVN